MFLCYVALNVAVCCRMFHAGQCKLTDGGYNELVVAIFRTGDGVKGNKNLYLLTL